MKRTFLRQYQSACAMGRILVLDILRYPIQSGEHFCTFYTGALLAIPVIALITNFALRRKNEGLE